jgi:hypothetical protein
MSSLNSSNIFLMASGFSAQHAAYVRMGFVPTTSSPYEAAPGEVPFSCSTLPSSDPIDPLCASNVPWDEVTMLLGECGLRSANAIRRITRPDDPSVEYRLLYANHFEAPRGKRPRPVEQSASALKETNHAF